jgi:peptidoglycan hydrolase CwlO-like protein
MKDNKQTYTHLKDFNHDMSYENESKITNNDRGSNDLENVISNLKKQVADAKIIDSVHQKLNGSLQKRVTELEIDNKRLVKEIDDLKERLRKCE